jgi:hypothetical protein
MDLKVDLTLIVSIYAILLTTYEFASKKIESKRKLKFDSEILTEKDD